MSQLQIASPRHGDVLNRHDGRLADGVLHVTVEGLAPTGAPVTVNGMAATVADGRFSCEVPITRRPQAIVAEGGGERCEITVLADFNSEKRYRYSIDDCIEVFRDLGQEPDSFPSLFDHWFLGFWKRMHDEYDTRVHINVYYQVTDATWNTSMLCDRWRDEWEANSHWLHLSFHALMDKPDRIYRAGTYQRLANDYDLVMTQVRRFAGEAVTKNVTTVHWAECPLEGMKALRDRGVDTFIGLFRANGGDTTTKYYLDQATSEYCAGRDAWCDVENGMTFVTCDSVVNGLTLENVVPTLNQQAANPHTGDMLELLIHEQYFCEHLSYWPPGAVEPVKYYQPDVMEKVEVSIRWASEQGYRPCFWSDGFLGSPE